MIAPEIPDLSIAIGTTIEEEKIPTTKVDTGEGKHLLVNLKCLFGQMHFKFAASFLFGEFEMFVWSNALSCCGLNQQIIFRFVCKKIEGQNRGQGRGQGSDQDRGQGPDPDLDRSPDLQDDSEEEIHPMKGVCLHLSLKRMTQMTRVTNWTMKQPTPMEHNHLLTITKTKWNKVTASHFVFVFELFVILKCEFFRSSKL